MFHPSPRRGGRRSFELFTRLESEKQAPDTMSAKPPSLPPSLSKMLVPRVGFEVKGLVAVSYPIGSVESVV